jgi:uncharacterized zinc-type alcohol dehydrogenase-like protein
MDSKYEHGLYKHVAENEADAQAWAFLDPETFVKFPFKFPELGEDEIRAKVTYAGLCLSDSLHARSKWGHSEYPLAPGHEIIGEVSAVGSKVTGFKAGDKIGFGVQRDCCDSCKCCNTNFEQLCNNVPHKFTYGTYWGGYSTHIQQPAKFFFHLPEGLDEKRASPLLCAGITVYQPIKDHAKPGDKTAVIGIGGLGHLAVQFLNKLGYHVTAFSSSLDKTEFLKQLGAHDVVNYTDSKSMTQHAGQYDFIINTAPIDEGFNSFVQLVAPLGKIVQVGLPEAGKHLKVQAFSLTGGNVTIVGSVIGSRKNITEMLELCVKSDIYPMCEEFSFEDFPKALDRLENGRPKFRCTVNVHEFSKKNNLFK